MWLLPTYFRKRQFLGLLAYNFVTSLRIWGPVIIPFFTEWGNLNMTQILTLQSIYLIVSLVAEIPTGVVADKIGRKVSVLLSDVLYAVGAVLYSAASSFYVFGIAEVLMGIGRAFFSGAEEALEYESLKEASLEEKYHEFIYKRRTVQLLANIVAGFLAFLLVRVIFVRYFMALYAVFELVAIGILLLFVKEPRTKEQREFVPDYRKILKIALENFRRSPSLLKLVGASLGLFVVSYFQYWLYQKIFLAANIDYSYFGLFSIFIYFMGIGLAQIFPLLYERIGLKRMALAFISFTFILQTLLPFVVSKILLVLVVLFLVATLREGLFLPNKEINRLTKSEARSTVLSFISLVKSTLVAFLNPLVGFVADKDVYIALVSVGFVGLILVWFSLLTYTSPESKVLT